MKYITLLFLSLFSFTYPIIEIKEATKDNKEELVTIHHISWHTAYQNMLPAKYHLKNTIERLDHYWNKFFTYQDNRFALIAVESDHIVGFITAGPVKIVPQENHSFSNVYAEIYKFYILPDYQHKGIGRLLLQNCFSRLIEQNQKYTHVIVRVFEENKPAICFYKNTGGYLLRTITYWQDLAYCIYEFDLSAPIF